jgi:hypothetical protein
MVTEVKHYVQQVRYSFRVGHPYGWPTRENYLIFNVTIENTTQSMVTIQNRVTILAS